MLGFVGHENFTIFSYYLLKMLPRLLNPKD